MARNKNNRLKKANSLVEYTPEQLIELEKCANDPVYFARNYVHIRHPIRGQILFDLYPYQEELLQNYKNNRFNIVLASRQVGKTETTAAFLLWFAIFHEDKTIIIASNKSKGAKEIMDRIQNAYEELPGWLKPGIDESDWNKLSCTFDNKSRIMAESTTIDTGRGFAVSLLYCDEFAHVKHHVQQQFWDSIYPTLSTGGACIISSTPNGDIDLYSTLWRGAELSANSFIPNFVPWDTVPGRDEKFKEAKIKDIGLQKWLQEYECHFLSSDSSLIDTKIIAIAEKSIENIKLVFEIEQQGFWDKIKKDGTYLVSLDPATGTGKDFSVIEVFEFPSMTQVMEYRTNTLATHIVYAYLKKVIKFLEFYSKDVYWSVENNGLGESILALYQNDDKAPDKATFISDITANRLGFFTTDISKNRSSLKLKNLFERGILKLKSSILLKEMKSFKRKGGSYAAQIGATDDCISSVLIILRIVEELAKHNDNAYFLMYTSDLNSPGTEWINSKDLEDKANNTNPKDEIMPFII